MAIRVAQSTSQRLNDQSMVYDLIHPRTGHLVRIRLGCNHLLDDAVEIVEFAEDRPGAEVLSFGDITYSDPQRGKDLAMGMAKMYERQGFRVCTEPPYERRKR